jgi:glycosyl transferase family 25
VLNHDPQKLNGRHVESRPSTSFNEFFPNKVCINLDKRKDRWERMQNRFAQHEIDGVVRFPALDGKRLEIPPHWDDFPGAFGCLRSHLSVVKQARQESRQSVMIFEDDAVFDSQFNARFSEYIDQIPSDWDMLFFGGIHGEPFSRISRNVMRIRHSLSTYSYALKHTIYDSFIELNRQALTVLDENTRALQKQFNCYCFMPHLAWVEEDYSDVRDETSNLWWLSESLVLWGREVDKILKKSAAIISYRRKGAASLRNLVFIVRYFSEQLPSVALLVVEQGPEPTLSSTDLPDQCQLRFLKDAGDRLQNRVFNLGFEAFKSGKDFFIFLDGDVFLTREDIKANLLKCREYDFVSLFNRICDLNEDDSLRILNNDLRWDYNGSYRPVKKSGICQSSGIFTNRGLQRSGGWQEPDDQDAQRTSMKVSELLKVFESPNPARRLFNG